MNAIRKLCLFVPLFSPFICPAFAGVVVSSPGKGAIVSSPFTLSASAQNCFSQPVAFMAYSLDNSATTSLFRSMSINASVSTSAGTHTLHVRAWGKRGATCVTNVSIDVQPNTLFTPITPPFWAVSVSDIQSLGDWAGASDTEASGSAIGESSVVSSPSLDGNTREFDVSFVNSGGERFYTSFGADNTTSNFLYDAYVYLDSTSSQIANLEFDLNQVLANGETVIYGVQCDGWNNTWDYTANTGTPTNWVDVWVQSPQYCNPRAWSINTWHHVQMAYSRDDNGVVTYKTVTLDGQTMFINATVPSAFSLGWGQTLLTNFQIDGNGTSGSASAWLDSLTIERW